MEKKKTWWMIGLLFLIYLSFFGNYIISENEYFSKNSVLLSLIDFLICSIVMMFVPLIWKLINKKTFNYEKGKLICKWNSIILFIISIILMATFDVSIIGGLGAVIYYFINKWFFLDDYLTSEGNIKNINYEKKKLKETSDERGETNKIKCNNCDHMISNELEKCPNCHIKFDNENPSNKKAKNEDLEELYKEGVINVQIGNYQQAEKELKEYIKEVNDLKKESEEEWYTFNNCIELMLFAKENDLSEKNIVDVNYNSSNAYFYLSVINFEKKEYDDAIKNLNKSLKWNPYNIHALFEKAENFKVKGDLKKYYSLTLDLYDKIYNLEDLAHYYRNLGYYFIETENLYLANAVYLYSIKFENNSVAFDELKYVISKSKNKVTIAKEELEDIMKENRIPTCISKEIIKSINNLYKKFIKEEQENTPAGKLLRNLVDELK